MLIKQRTQHNYSPQKMPATMDLEEIFFSYAHRNDTILDIGCGSGRTLLSLHEQGFTDLTGVDYSSPNILYPTIQRAQPDAPNIHFVQADARTMPFPDQSFQIGIMQALLTTFPTRIDQFTCLTEAYRVLKPQGGLYLGEFLQSWDHPRYCERYLEGMKLGLEKGTFPRYNKRNEFEDLAHHFALEEIIFLLADARFRIDYCDLPWLLTRSGNRIHGVVIIAVKEAFLLRS